MERETHAQTHESGRETSTLRARLAEERRRFFVGRRKEVALAESLLGGEPPRPHILFTGPAGIGKTTLLREISARARQKGFAVLEIDAGQETLSPPRLAGIVECARNAEPGVGAPLILAIDNLDTARILGDQDFAPDDHGRAPQSEPQVVAAARTMPDAKGSAASQAVRHVELEELSEEEVDRYLDLRDLSSRQMAPAKRLAAGNPLALCLASDSATAQGTPFAEDGVLAHLTRRFLDDALSAEQVSALQASAVARTIDIDLLQAMLPEANAARLAEWLRTLSCIHPSGPEMYLHEAIRNTIFEDVRLRRGDLLETLARRAEAYFSERALRGPARNGRGGRGISDQLLSYSN